MPKTVIHRFCVEKLQILDAEGNCDKELMPDLSAEEVLKLYEWMVLARSLDERACQLQREGRLGTYASLRGQEAAQVGSAFALQPSDWVFPSYREAAVSVVRGLPLRMIFQYWSGDERGSFIPRQQNDFPVSIPVGTQIPIAVGAAWAAKAKGDPVAVITYFGDGATSKGDFHEGLNMAGIFSLPIVFFCQNNHWAISVSRQQQTRSESLAQKAISYGFRGIQLDGNDVFGVYRGTREALCQARNERKPTLIEAITYRLGDHTTADDASRYRSRDELEQWRQRDPIERLRKYMARRGLWDEAYDRRTVEEVKNRIEAAVDEMEAACAPDPKDIFQYTFAEMTPELIKEMRAFQQDGRNGKIEDSGVFHGHMHTR